MTTSPRKLRRAYEEVLSNLAPNFFITFNFGYRVSGSSAFEAIKRFCNMLEREGLGRYWHKYGGSRRLVLVAFGEHPQTNPHWHAMARVPDSMAKVLPRKRVRARGTELWFKLAPRGQLWVEEIDDQDKVVHYTTKGLIEADATDRVFIYKSPAQNRKKAAAAAGS